MTRPQMKSKKTRPAITELILAEKIRITIPENLQTLIMFSTVDNILFHHHSQMNHKLKKKIDRKILKIETALRTGDILSIAQYCLGIGFDLGVFVVTQND